MEATIQGCRIFYRYTKAAKANGPTILLLHGWGCDGSIFSFIEKGLSEVRAWQVVSSFLPASGQRKSRKPFHDFLLGGAAGDAGIQF